MSAFEGRVRRAQKRDLKKWARIIKYTGYAGATLTGAVSAWFIAAVVVAG